MKDSVALGLTLGGAVGGLVGSTQVSYDDYVADAGDQRVHHPPSSLEAREVAAVYRAILIHRYEWEASNAARLPDGLHTDPPVFLVSGIHPSGVAAPTQWDPHTIETLRGELPRTGIRAQICPAGCERKHANEIEVRLGRPEFTSHRTVKVTAYLVGQLTVGRKLAWAATEEYLVQRRKEGWIVTSRSTPYIT